MIIREAHLQDCESLLPMAAALSASFVVKPAIFRNSFAECISDESSLVLLAEADSLPIGYLLGFDHLALFANGRVSRVEEIYVMPEHRRKGVGDALMRSFEEWAQSRASAQVIVCTRRASGFYSTLGYEETATCFRKVLRENAEEGGAADALTPVADL